MLIRNDSTLLDDLYAHYRRSGFRVEPVEGGMVDIAREDGSTGEHDRREVLLHLRVWGAANPDKRADLVAYWTDRGCSVPTPC